MCRSHGSAQTAKEDFHFPRQDKSPERRKKWIDAVRRGREKGQGLWAPSASSVVCLEHFPQADFKDTLLGRHLKKEISLFNIFLSPDMYVQAL